MCLLVRPSSWPPSNKPSKQQTTTQLRTSKTGPVQQSAHCGPFNRLPLTQWCFKHFPTIWWRRLGPCVPPILHSTKRDHPLVPSGWSSRRLFRRCRIPNCTMCQICRRRPSWACSVKQIPCCFVETRCIRGAPATENVDSISFHIKPGDQDNRRGSIRLWQWVVWGNKPHFLIRHFIRLKNRSLLFFLKVVYLSQATFYKVNATIRTLTSKSKPTFIYHTKNTDKKFDATWTQT